MLKEISIKVNKILNSKKVDYFIIGRIAVACWGNPVTTLNMDIVISIKKGLEELLDEFAKVGFKFEKERTYKKLMDGKPAKLWYKEDFSIDLRIVRFTIDFESLSSAKKIKLWNNEWKIAALEELIIYKLGSAKSRDWEDIKSILRNKTIKLDWDRMEYLAKTLQDEFEKNFLKKYEKLRNMRGNY